MKQILTIAKRSLNDRDGFVYGFVRGAAGGVCFISILTVISAIIRF